MTDAAGILSNAFGNIAQSSAIGPQLELVARMKHAETANALAGMQMQEHRERQGILSSYRTAAQAGDPNATSLLAGLPDVQAQAQKNQMVQEQYRNERVGRAAQELRDAYPTAPDGSVPPQRVQAYQTTIAQLHKEGVIPSLMLPQLASQIPDDKFLHGVINRAMPLQAAETPKYQEIGQDKYGAKNFGFVDANRQTINGRPINSPDAAHTGVGNYGTRLEGLTGKEFLDALDPGDRSQVQAIIEGRKPPPSPNARTPFTQRLAEWVAQADPGFDNTAWRARNQLRAEFSSTKNGTAGGNIQALETAINHGDKLRTAHEALNNSGIPLGTIAREWVGNPLARNLSEGMSNFDAREGGFNAVRKGYFDEVAKVFAGTSGGVFDRAEWEHKLNSASSPAKRDEVISTLTEMMKGRLTALANSANRNNLQYGKEFGPYDLVNPTTSAKMKRILKEDGDLAPPGSKSDHGPLPQTQTAPPPNAAKLMDQVRAGAKEVTLPSGRVLSAQEYTDAYNQKYGAPK